jgi:hypothetical protein
VFSWAIVVYELMHYTVLLSTVLGRLPLGYDQQQGVAEYAAAVAAGYR